MEGFADDITLSIENSTESLTEVTKVIANFGNLSGLRINKDKTQTMIFGHNSETTAPTTEDMGFEWVKEIKILGVTITCDLKDMDTKNFNNKFEEIEKMLKHWSYRTLNLEGRITITKSLALPKLTHLATVLPELDNQKAKQIEDLTNKFIWKTFKDQKNKKSVRVNNKRAKLKPNKGGIGIMDTVPFWMGGKMGWLRKILQKEYNEPPRTNNLHNQQVNNNINKENDTEDWLKMLINDLAILSGDVSLTPNKIITGWGTQKMRKIGLKIKNKFWKAVFTGIEKLEEGFYHINQKYLGEMVIWDTQGIRTRGIQLTAKGANSIGYVFYILT
jgi:hypothetical protein